MGFFEGTDGEAFPHAVTTAYLWSTDGMAARLARAGFEVLDVIHGPILAGVLMRR